MIYVGCGIFGISQWGYYLIISGSWIGCSCYYCYLWSYSANAYWYSYSALSSASYLAIWVASANFCSYSIYAFSDKTIHCSCNSCLVSFDCLSISSAYTTSCSILSTTYCIIYLFTISFVFRTSSTVLNAFINLINADPSKFFFFYSSFS